MREGRLDLLASPPFLLSLVVLVLNDHVFKRAFPGAITGKLSDFAGLFAFTLFCVALFPVRRLWIGGAIAMSFVAWKLPIAQPAIDFWNRKVAFPIGRTVDVTDLIALIVIPLAIASSQRAPRSRRATWAIAVASVMAFAATSYRSPYDFALGYEFAGTPQELTTRLTNAGVRWYDRSGKTAEESFELELTIPADVCFDSIDGDVVVHRGENATQVWLLKLTHHCPRGRDDRRRLQEAFEAAVVKPLDLKPITRK